MDALVCNGCVNTIDIANGAVTAAKVADGAGSGLDADLLDGLEATAFGRLAVTNTWTGENTFIGTTLGVLGQSSSTSGAGSSVWPRR